MYERKKKGARATVDILSKGQNLFVFLTFRPQQSSFVFLFI